MLSACVLRRNNYYLRRLLNWLHLQEVTGKRMRGENGKTPTRARKKPNGFIEDKLHGPRAFVNTERVVRGRFRRQKCMCGKFGGVQRFVRLGGFFFKAPFLTSHTREWVTKFSWPILYCYTLRLIYMSNHLVKETKAELYVVEKNQST